MPERSWDRSSVTPQLVCRLHWVLIPGLMCESIAYGSVALDQGSVTITAVVYRATSGKSTDPRSLDRLRVKARAGLTCTQET